MKKLFLMFSMLSALALCSCGNETSAASNSNTSSEIKEVTSNIITKKYGTKNYKHESGKTISVIGLYQREDYTIPNYAFGTDGYIYYPSYNEDVKDYILYDMSETKTYFISGDSLLIEASKYDHAELYTILNDGQMLVTYSSAGYYRTYTRVE
ncbi:MAG: hypothetical protein K6E20_03770 [Acholeplasmatales bacterium]|nr:hypothetical protein [Acholeplasmatales bacterium]